MRKDLRLGQLRAIVGMKFDHEDELKSASFFKIWNNRISRFTRRRPR